MITDSAVGLVSVIGYTPNIFFGPLMGYILDENLGAFGHHYLFGLITPFALIGYIGSIQFRKQAKRL